MSIINKYLNLIPDHFTVEDVYAVLDKTVLVEIPVDHFSDYYVKFSFDHTESMDIRQPDHTLAVAVSYIASDRMLRVVMIRLYKGAIVRTAQIFMFLALDEQYIYDQLKLPRVESTPFTETPRCNLITPYANDSGDVARIIASALEERGGDVVYLGRGLPILASAIVTHRVINLVAAINGVNINLTILIYVKSGLLSVEINQATLIYQLRDPEQFVRHLIIRSTRPRQDVIIKLDGINIDPWFQPDSFFTP